MTIDNEHSLASSAAQIRDLLSASRNLAAVEMARAACARNPHSGELAYLYALGCLRSGALDAAQSSIETLRKELVGHDALQADVESMAGRLAKERFLVAISETKSLEALTSGIEAYRRADGLKPNLHAKINAATLLRMVGAQSESEALAHDILAELRAEQEELSYWNCATQAEALLLTGDVASATYSYAQAARLAGSRFGDIASTRRQLQLLARVFDPAHQMLQAIPGPKVVAFSGHMIDTDDRSSTRFPHWLEPAVQTAIDHAVGNSVPVIAYTQAACGCDILFCESLLARSQEVNIVLPFAVEDYIAQSVLPGGAYWVDRFERVMAGATSITFATEERYLGDDSLFEHASNLIQGMAFLRAKELAVKPNMLVVADFSQTGGTGGTLATQAQWSQQVAAVEAIDRGDLRRITQKPVAATQTSAVARLRPVPRCRAQKPPPESAGGRYAETRGSPLAASRYLPLMP